MMYSTSRLRRIAWQNCPRPMERVSPSPETPMYCRLRLAAFAPLAIEGMRPCTELNPCDPPTKYAVVFDEQPMPDNFTNCSGRSERPQHASMMDAVTESWPQPAHKVDMLPSYWRRVIPSVFVGSDGWATFGLLM